MLNEPLFGYLKPAYHMHLSEMFIFAEAKDFGPIPIFWRYYDEAVNENIPVFDLLCHTAKAGRDITEVSVGKFENFIRRRGFLRQFGLLPEALPLHQARNMGEP